MKFSLENFKSEESKEALKKLKIIRKDEETFNKSKIIGSPEEIAKFFILLTTSKNKSLRLVYNEIFCHLAHLNISKNNKNICSNCSGCRTNLSDENVKKEIEEFISILKTI